MSVRNQIAALPDSDERCPIGRCASCGLPEVISATIERRIASVRPIRESAAIAANAPVVSFTAYVRVDLIMRDQKCPRPGIEKCAGQARQRLALLARLAAVLQAERYLSSLAVLGGVEIKPGSAVPENWPAKAPCVAKCTTRH
jgi:hypothetical protein